MNLTADSYLFEDDEDYIFLNSSQTRYFIFICDKNLYAINASIVIEIIETPAMTKVPMAQSCILGVANVRGSIISVIDLRDLFGLGKTIIGKKTSLAIIQAVQKDKLYDIGILIDEIFEVDGLDEASFMQTPIFGSKIDPLFIKHMAKYANQEVTVLDVDKVLDIKRLCVIYDTVQKDDDNDYIIKDVKKNNRLPQNYDDDDEDELDILRLISNTVGDANQFLIFYGPGRQLYAKNVAKVEEIVTLSELNIVKNYDDNIIIGTAEIRGEALALVNFDVWLGYKNINENDYQEALLLNYGGYKFGLVVRSTASIVSINPNEMKDNSKSDSKSSFIARINLENQEVLCSIIDSDILLKDCFIDISEKVKKDFNAITKLNVSSKTVFFADDSKFIRSLIEGIAEKLCLTFKIFNNGKELLDAIEQTNADDIGLIVTDIEMPILDGRGVIEFIRSKDKYNDVNLIVHTNLTNKALKEELIKSGVNFIIGKVDVASLGDAIMRYIRQ